MVAALRLGVSRVAGQRCYAVATSAIIAASRSSSFLPQHCVISFRYASTAKDIFVAPKDSLTDIPDIPVISMPSEATGSGFSFYEKWLLKVDVLDMFGLSGLSTVDSTGLFAWYSPASWYRIILESMHNYFDLPWFASIICTTLCLRIVFLRATLFLQRYYYFMLNSTLFVSQYRGISLMAENNFPGWNTGGALWFLDLTATDPNFLVPALSSVLIGCTLFLGYDPTGTASTNKYVKAFKYLVLPVGVFLFSSRVPVAISLYWCASNFFNVLLTTTLRIPKIRYALDIPIKVTPPSSATLQTAWSRAFVWKKETEKQARSRPVMWEIMQRQDLQRFAKASGPSATK